MLWDKHLNALISAIPVWAIKYNRQLNINKKIRTIHPCTEFDPPYVNISFQV